MQVNTPMTGVKADFSQLDAPNRARAALGGAIGEVGAQVGEFAQKLQATVNYGIAADADRQMRQATADFQASRAGRNDPDNWGEEWKKMSDQTWSNINDTHAVGPALKRQLTQNYKDWQQANAIEVNSMANQKRIGLAVDHTALAVDEAAKDGHADFIQGAYDPLVKLGAITPDHAKLLVQQGLEKADRYAADRFISANPVMGEAHLMETDPKGKYVNFPHMDDNTRVTLAFQANRFAQIKRAQVASGFFQQRQDFLSQDPGDGVTDVNPDEVRQAVKDGYLAPAQAKPYLKPPKADFDPKAAADLKGEIMGTDFSTDQGNLRAYEYMAQIAGVAAGNKDAMSDLQQTLKRKTDPKDSLNSPVGKDALQIIDDSFKKGLYGQYEKTIPADANDPESKPKIVTDAKAYAAARQVQQHNLDAVDKFLHENPTASREDTFKFLSSLNEKPVAAKGSQLFGGAPVAPLFPAQKANVTQAEYDGLKPGQSYYWNGEMRTKKAKK